ncbi:MAG: thymidine phosphorylase [Bacteroidota bacterium]
MNPVELIRKKRNGGALAPEEISWLVGAYAKGELPDYQMSAFLMAVCFRGMTADETTAFVDIMLHSGKVIDLSSIPGRKVDKHSTGGVGDKVSLILAPMVAACGVPVPMISGRGLGHTGGTLDKLESIPGFRTDLTIDEYREVIRDIGLVMIGQTAEIAPADRRMYALRDVTATVESIPLIAGSIMSKKLAEGIDALVLDIKSGDGAFMKTYNDAVTLGRTLVGIGTAAGKDTLGMITAMDQPLGAAIGNWCEVEEAMDCLRGKNVVDLMEVTYALGGAMVYFGGKAASIAEGMALCRSAIWSGAAHEKFLQLVERQGGDIAYLNEPGRVPAPRHRIEVRATSSGFVAGCATMKLGVLAVELGAGRRKVDDVIDPTAGIVLAKKVGDHTEKGETLATISTNREDAVRRAAEVCSASITIVPERVALPPRVQALIDRDGVKPWTAPTYY